MRLLIIGVAALFIGCPSSFAEQPFNTPLVPIAPESVTLPNMTTQQKVDLSDFDSYYYFYKSGVGYAAAFADLDECRLYAETAQMTALVPTFVPVSDVASPTRLNTNGLITQFGVVGGAFAGILVESAMEDLRNGTDRRCMRYKGYARYGTTKDVWKQLSVGGDGPKLARMALLASGSAPQSEPIAP